MATRSRSGEVRAGRSTTDPRAAAGSIESRVTACALAHRNLAHAPVTVVDEDASAVQLTGQNVGFALGVGCRLMHGDRCRFPIAQDLPDADLARLDVDGGGRIDEYVKPPPTL